MSNWEETLGQMRNNTVSPSGLGIVWDSPERAGGHG